MQANVNKQTIFCIIWKERKSGKKIECVYAYMHIIIPQNDDGFFYLECDSFLNIVIHFYGSFAWAEIYLWTCCENSLAHSLYYCYVIKLFNKMLRCAHIRFQIVNNWISLLCFSNLWCLYEHFKAHNMAWNWNNNENNWNMGWIPICLSPYYTCRVVENETIFN